MKSLPKNQTHRTTIETPFGEVDVIAQYSWQNDGIGAYEFGGAKQFDAGTDYPEIEDIVPQFTQDDEEDHRVNVIEDIDRQYDLYAEKIAEKINAEAEANAEPEYDPTDEMEDFEPFRRDPEDTTFFEDIDPISELI